MTRIQNVLPAMLIAAGLSMLAACTVAPTMGPEPGTPIGGGGDGGGGGDNDNDGGGGNDNGDNANGGNDNSGNNNGGDDNGGAGNENDNDNGQVDPGDLFDTPTVTLFVDNLAARAGSLITLSCILGDDGGDPNVTYAFQSTLGGAEITQIGESETATAMIFAAPQTVFYTCTGINAAGEGQPSPPVQVNVVP